MSLKNLKSEAQTWLEPVFEKHNISNLVVNICGNSEKGDGYIGDIVFATASGTSDNREHRQFKLVLKCSKQNEALRKEERFRAAFINEIYFYDHILPVFHQYQLDRNVESLFKITPKCYGTYQDEKIEVIVLENLKEEGFDLFPRKQCLTKTHIDLVIGAYAKYHATSLAMQIQEPEQYQKIAAQSAENLKCYEKGSENTRSMFESCIEDAYNALKDDLDEEVLLKWKKFQENVGSVMESFSTSTVTKVITHGDCWSNNFMYKYKTEDSAEDKATPCEVKILDWQMVRSSSLITDLSYFLFCCISEQDINKLDDILSSYHKNLSKHLSDLGIADPHAVYSHDKFVAEWKKHCLYGVVLAGVLIKIHSVDKEDVVDSSAAAEQGKGFLDLILGKVPDKTVYRRRMKYIIEYVVKNGLL